MAQAFLGQLDPALASLDRAVALDPDNATYRFNRGLLHYQSGDRDGARRDFLRAQELWPENPQIARMVQVVEDPTQYQLQMASSPVHMELPDAQRQELAGKLAEGSGNSAAGDLADLVSADPEVRRRMLADLEARYAEDRDPLTRLKLAQSAMLAEEPALAQRTLAPFWPDQLVATERRLLLHADRMLGDPSRAAEIASGLNWPGASEDVEMLTLAATILLDHDRRDEARVLVDRALAVQPENAMLQAMHRSLAAAP
jgi:Flp pilus assembly protein TadD